MKKAYLEIEEEIAGGLESQAADIENTISIVRKHGFDAEIKFAVEELRNTQVRLRKEAADMRDAIRLERSRDDANANAETPIGNSGDGRDCVGGASGRTDDSRRSPESGKDEHRMSDGVASFVEEPDPRDFSFAGDEPDGSH